MYGRSHAPTIRCVVDVELSGVFASSGMDENTGRHIVSYVKRLSGHDSLCRAFSVGEVALA